MALLVEQAGGAGHGCIRAHSRRQAGEAASARRGGARLGQRSRTGAQPVEQLKFKKASAPLPVARARRSSTEMIGPISEQDGAINDENSGRADHAHAGAKQQRSQAPVR